MASSSGASRFVASPDGAVVKRASPNREEVLVVACDLAKVEFARTHWPFLRDRRIDAYGGLTERFVRRHVGLGPTAVSARVKILSGTPAEHGYAFPAEWTPHAATWISWPRPEGISFPGFYHRSITRRRARGRRPSARSSRSASTCRTPTTSAS